MTREPPPSGGGSTTAGGVFAIAGGQLAGWAVTEYGLFGGPSDSFWHSAPGMLIRGVWDLHKEPMLQRGWYSELTGGWNIVLAIHATVAMMVTSFVIAWVVNRSLLWSVGIATLLTGAVGAALVWYYDHAPMPANPGSADRTGTDMPLAA